MDILENFLQNNNLSDPDNMDSLLECADIVRQLISEKQYDGINTIINYTVDQNYTDGFLWTMTILQEEVEKEGSILEDFLCPMGGRITHYDDFVQNLQVDFNSIKNYIEKVYDDNGEVEAFFNVMIYKTGFENIFLVSSENFDNKDNDYIQYKISFVKDKEIYYR